MKSKTTIIAEVGINHNSSIKIAKKLIKKSQLAGADYVKFQIFKPEFVASKIAKKSSYQKKNYKDKETQLDMIRKYELQFNKFKILKKECRKNQIKFLCSPFDTISAKFLKSIGEKIIKIPSGEITNLVLLRLIGSFKLKVILSTGMSNFSEINQAIKILINSGTKRRNISLLHCVTAYPTPMKYVNLKAINKMRKKFKLNIGLSDHTKGTEASIAAVALGANIIEKHITLDKKFKGPDHKSSLDTDEFKRLVESIRNIEIALGKDTKKIQKCEKENLKIARKSLVAQNEIVKGEIFSVNNLTVKRPGNGISPMQWDKYLGKKSNRNYKKDELIKK